jgi:uncharacterized protein YbjQ (UPF0145 family)
MAAARGKLMLRAPAPFLPRVARRLVANKEMTQIRRGVAILRPRILHRPRRAEAEALEASRMIVATTENIAGYRTVQTLGQCFGVVVRSRGLGGNLMAGLRSIVGGEIHEYTQLLEEARRHALDRLVQNAATMGANAVVMMRYDSAEIGNTMSEIVAYGTAAVIEPVR